jgi:anti-anti-sigma factor
MTTMPPARLRLTTVDTEDTVRVELHGDLDYDNADHLLSAVTEQLAQNPGLRALHVHCAGLGDVDSMGLSVLLMIRRMTTEAGVRLRLDDRPARLDRLLTVTGTMGYLTVSADDAENSSRDGGEPLRTGEEANRSARPRPDATT